jgi:hypothetical protein
LEGFQNPELVSHNNSLSIAQLFIRELSKLRTGFQPTTTAFTIFKESIPLNLFKERQLKSASTSDKEKLELRAKTTIPSNYS